MVQGSLSKYGQWLNPTGYVLHPTGKWEPGMGYLFGLGALVGWRRKRRQYEFRLDPVAPLTFEHPNGFYVQPDRHGFTDLGSIPEILEPFVHRTSYEPSFLLHDSACREHGLYFSSQVEGPFVFCEIGSDAAHRLLRMTTRAEGAWRQMSWAIYQAVYRFGPQWELGAPALA